MEKQQKINKLLQSQPAETVFLSSWLAQNGFSSQLINRYRKSKWLYSLGNGAWIRVGEKATYQSAIYALQNQSNLTIHLGGKTALSLLGKAHYLELNKQQIMLFGATEEKLPTWFTNYQWGVKINFYRSSFLPSKLGLQLLKVEAFDLQISDPIRAFLECLYLAPKKQGLIECYEIMEGLNNLRPKQVQNYLEQCNSIKVKRLFLYMADKANHQWFKFIDLKNINLGKGKRSFGNNGVYISKYSITVSKELVNYE